MYSSLSRYQYSGWYRSDSPGPPAPSRSCLGVYTPARRLWWTEFQPWLFSCSDALWRSREQTPERRLTVWNAAAGLNPSLFNVSPCLKLVVVHAVSISKDEEVVLLVALAGFVFHVPVVLPRDLVIVPKAQKSKSVSPPRVNKLTAGSLVTLAKAELQIFRHVIHPLLKVPLALAKRVLIRQEIGHKLISFLVHHSSEEETWGVNVHSRSHLCLNTTLHNRHLIMAWDIISTPAGPDMSLGAGSESKMTWAHGLIHIWSRRRMSGKKSNRRINIEDFNIPKLVLLHISHCSAFIYFALIISTNPKGQ